MINAARPLVLDDSSIEDVMDALDAWLRDEPTRECHVSVTIFSRQIHICWLYQGGHRVVAARGQGSVAAIAHALESASEDA